MTISNIELKESIDKAYRLIKPKRVDLNVFKNNMLNLLNHIDEKESEENVKIHLADFLKNTFYHPDYLVATMGRADLVIHLGKESKAPVGVLFEIKKPTNKAEMISKNNLNTKAMHELILYFLRERINNKNISLTHLIITNVYEWYVFDASHFDRIFAQNKDLQKSYIEWDNGQKINTNTDLFYKEIAKPFLFELTKEMSFTYFDIRDYFKSLANESEKDNRKLIALYKFFTPIHLLKLPFVNDSNSLNKGFFAELLHIIGLEEVKDGSRKIIRRLPEESRRPGSLVENAIDILELENSLRKIPNSGLYGIDHSEQVFSLGLELSITWINRILFLKLLEAQLLKYHSGDRKYKFLNQFVINDYDELYKLFFQVLAKEPGDRNALIKKKYGHIPYLNSSLFEISELEDQTIKVNSLDDNLSIDIFPNSVLKKSRNRKDVKSLNTLHYLFEFLEAYDFASVGKEEIQEENKTIINAAVLGLVFEKINGYRDGSIYTPGAVTTFLCKETIRRAVVKKFNDNYGWHCESVDDLNNYLADRRSTKDILEFNSIINTVKIVDPAVGSGHFLVSSLNEMISIKADLGILADESGKRLADAEVTIANDELVIVDKQSGNFFEYAVFEGNAGRTVDANVQRLQQTMFNEKRRIIEGCLFGVDINPNSVKICRLRLWIELLKHAYYKANTNFLELETLPNIDINIKNGNSLLSKYSLTEDLSEVFKRQKTNAQAYQLAVEGYKNAPNKDTKVELLQFIKNIKDQFRESVRNRDPLRGELARLRGKLALVLDNNDLFGQKKAKKDVQKEGEKLRKELEKKESELKDRENNVIYKNAFEWRFEFPEVLDEKGEFEGFEVVIGNPPYIQLQKMGADANILANQGFRTFVRTGDIYSLFYEQAVRLLKKDYYFGYITSNQWMKANYGAATRNFLLEESNPLLLIDCSDYQIFESATVLTNILVSQKSEYSGATKACTLNKSLGSLEKMSVFIRQNIADCNFKLGANWIIISKEAADIREKVMRKGRKLCEWEITINYGIKTGLNEAFIITSTQKAELISKDPKSAEIIRPILRGRDVNKYHFEHADLWLINFHNGVKELGISPLRIDDYPAIKNHLDSYLPLLENRSDKGDTLYNLRNCAYMDDFSKQKIIWKRVGSQIRFSYDESGVFCLDSTCFATGKDLKFLVGYLNSSFARLELLNNSPKTGTGDVITSVQALEPLFVPNASIYQKQYISDLVDLLLFNANNNLPSIPSVIEEIDNLIFEIFEFSDSEIKYLKDQL